MSSALLLNLVKPEVPMSEKFDLVMQYFGKMAGDEILQKIVSMNKQSN